MLKHFAWRSWPEGLAVLTPHRLVHADPFVLRRSLLLTWRRRVAIDAVVERDGDRVGVVDVHLSPWDEAPARVAEVGLVLDQVGARPDAPIVAGDFNEEPAGAGVQAMVAAGWQDAWATSDRRGTGDGATNWTSGDRRGRSPTQRLDYVFVPFGWVVEEATVLAEPARHDWFAERSDHLPLLVRARREGAQEQ